MLKLIDNINAAIAGRCFVASLLSHAVLQCQINPLINLYYLSMAIENDRSELPGCGGSLRG